MILLLSGYQTSHSSNSNSSEYSSWTKYYS
jgi:hypothetical protein